MNSFPKTLPEWKNDVARRLNRLRLDINTIMINLPMLPDPEIGMPFTGPLSPVPFVFPAQTDRSGGTPGTGGTGGTSTAGGCPGANKIRVLSYTITGGCGDAGTYTSLMTFTGTFSGGGTTYCYWTGSGFHELRYYTAGPNTGILEYIGPLFWDYRTTALPPNVGSSVNLSFVSPINTCTYPGTITVQGEL